MPQTVADFYAGRAINVYIGFSPGGAYDIYARQLARFMGSHLPGHPTLVPQNMAGAGGLRLANFLYNVAAKDGTAIGTFSRGLVTAPLLAPALVTIPENSSGLAVLPRKPSYARSGRPLPSSLGTT